MSARTGSIGDALTQQLFPSSPLNGARAQFRRAQRRIADDCACFDRCICTGGPAWTVQSKRRSRLALPPVRRTRSSRTRPPTSRSPAVAMGEMFGPVSSRQSTAEPGFSNRGRRFNEVHHDPPQATVTVGTVEGCSCAGRSALSARRRRAFRHRRVGRRRSHPAPRGTRRVCPRRVVHTAVSLSEDLRPAAHDK